MNQHNIPYSRDIERTVLSALFIEPEAVKTVIEAG